MITDTLTAAPGNGAPIGGLKVVTDSAWFAARPSGTEDVYKIYAESFRGPGHLADVQAEARSGRPHAMASLPLASPSLTATVGHARERAARSRPENRRVRP